LAVVEAEVVESGRGGVERGFPTHDNGWKKNPTPFSELEEK